MITFSNDFERTFWCERYTYWENAHYPSEQTAAEYADQCLKEVRERNSMPKEQLEKQKDSASPKEECPCYKFYGMRYGVDTGKSIACNTCHIYQHCKDAKDFKNVKPV